MRKHLDLIALVVMAAVSLAGCHRTPTAPPPPDPLVDGSQSVTANSAKKGGGPGGGGPAATVGVELAGGMNGASQPLTVQKDSQRELNLQGPHTGSADMASTWGLRASVCAPQKGDPTAGEQEALLEKLLDPPQDRTRLVVVVDRDGGDHRLTLNWTDEATSPFENLVLNVTNGVTVSEGPTDTFHFSGGDVLIQDRRGKVKDHVTLRCQNLDTITVVVTR